jgi:DNA-binding HxlR family transcriptional regulator
MQRTSFARMHCSLARSLEVMGDWWTPLILRDLYFGLGRFADLVENLGVSRNLLSARLATLVERGLIERRRYSDHPPRDRYVLTTAGRELVPVLMALTAWGDRWVGPSAGPPVRFQHRACGHIVKPEIVCSHCSRRLVADQVVPRRGPGRRAGRGTRLIGRGRLQRPAIGAPRAARKSSGA